MGLKLMLAVIDCKKWCKGDVSYKWWLKNGLMGLELMSAMTDSYRMSLKLMSAVTDVRELV